MFAFYENQQKPYFFDYAENLTYPPHIHESIELVFVSKGQLSVIVNDRQKLLKAGEAAVIFPNTIHSFLSNENNGAFYVIFNIEFVPEYTNIFTAMRPKCPFLFQEQQHADVSYAIQAIFKWSGDNNLLRGYLLVLTSRVLEQMEFEKITVSQTDNILSKLLMYIGDHFRENITLEQIAKSLGVSKYHLSRTFSRKMGYNFNMYINMLRARTAKRLLLSSSEKSITYICYESGFNSPSTFYRIFKLEYGKTPRDLKRKIIHNANPIP